MIHGLNTSQGDSLHITCSLPAFTKKIYLLEQMWWKFSMKRQQYNGSERHLPSYQKLLSTLGFGSKLRPDVHGEKCWGRIENWGQITHEGWQHDRQHNATHPTRQVFQHQFGVSRISAGYSRATKLVAFLRVHTGHLIGEEDPRNHACREKVN